jgi:hypothetical protein
MKGWHPVDWIVLSLVMIVVMTFGAMEYRLTKAPSLMLSDSQADGVGSLIDAIISVVSVYVGASIQRRRDRDEDERDKDE